MRPLISIIVLAWFGISTFVDAEAEPKAAADADPTPEAKAAPTADAKPDHPNVIHHGNPYPVTPVPPYDHPPYSPLYHSVPSIHGRTPSVLGYSSATYGHFLSPYSKHQPQAHYVPYAQAHYPKKCDYKETPLCAHNTTKPWCLSDYEYPAYDIKSAISYHKEGFLGLYADVADLSTENSVIGPRSFYEETYLCTSETSYSRPLRAVNTEGKWRIIVNNVKVDYDVFTQTARLEECLTYGTPCPLVPPCYESTCVQKSIYHRFLIYDPCDDHFPFAVESFKLPASCACLVGKFYIDH